MGVQTVPRLIRSTVSIHGVVCTVLHNRSILEPIVPATVQCE